MLCQNDVRKKENNENEIVVIGILTAYVSVQRNKKLEVDSADRACEVSTLTEGFVFTLYKNIYKQSVSCFITWFKVFTKGKIKNKQNNMFFYLRHVNRAFS